MSVASVIRSVDVKTTPARAFDLFTSHIERWWPVGKTVAKKPHVAIVIEPRPEGRWFERDADGGETQWGKVLVWEPPSRLLLAWQLNSQWTYQADLVTEVELTFSARAEGGTRVTLEHRDLERFGDDAARIADKVGGGWPRFLADFAAYADARSSSGGSDA